MNNNICSMSPRRPIKNVIKQKYCHHSSGAEPKGKRHENTTQCFLH